MYKIKEKEPLQVYIYILDPPLKTPYPYAENRPPQSLSPHTPYPQQFLCMSEDTEEEEKTRR